MIMIKRSNNGFTYSIAALFFMVSIMACNSATSTKETENQVPEKNASDTVELTKAQIETVGIEAGTIQQKNLGELIKVNGQLMVPPDSKANVNTLIGGLVRSILVREGAYVRKGQVLAYIENPEFIRMQQEYLTTKSNLVYVTQEYERQKRLNDQNAGTGKVFQQAQATYLSEQARLSSLAKQLQQIHINPARLDKGSIKTQIPVLSPINGQVAHILITIGSSADLNKSLMEIIDNTAIYCDLKIFEKDATLIRSGQNVSYALSGQEGYVFTGTIRSVNSTYETENRVVIAHASINEVGSRLIAGTYVTASIQVGNKLVRAVPVDAIVNTEGKDFIYQIISDYQTDPDSKAVEMKFRRMEVIIGLTDMGYVEIKLLKPLPDEAKIVVKGARYVLAQSQAGQSEEDE